MRKRIIIVKLLRSELEFLAAAVFPRRLLNQALRVLFIIKIPSLKR